MFLLKYLSLFNTQGDIFQAILHSGWQSSCFWVFVPGSNTAIVRHPSWKSSLVDWTFVGRNALYWFRRLICMGKDIPAEYLCLNENHFLWGMISYFLVIFSYDKPEKCSSPTGLQDLAGHKIWPHGQGLIAPHTATSTQGTEEAAVGMGWVVILLVLVRSLPGRVYTFLLKIIISGKCCLCGKE